MTLVLKLVVLLCRLDIVDSFVVGILSCLATGSDQSLGTCQIPVEDFPWTALIVSVGPRQRICLALMLAVTNKLLGCFVEEGLHFVLVIVVTISWV